MAERRARDLPPYFQTVRHAYTAPQAEVAALSHPLRIHRVPAHEARPNGVTRSRLAINFDRSGAAKPQLKSGD
jgi:hypothetical protein